jgi:hypothetical protein
MTLITAAVWAACSSLPADNAQLDAARNDYRAAQGNPAARDLASSDLKQAGDALARPSDAWSRGERPAAVNPLACVATQRVAIAQETGRLKAAEQALVNATAQRDKDRLAARTNEADAAARNAESAQRAA